MSFILGGFGIILLGLMALFFAGMRGRKKAKRNWTGVVVILFTAFTTLILLSLKDSSSDEMFLGVLIIILGGGLAGLLLNSTGRLIIDIFAAILPDNRDPMVRAFEEKKSDAEYKQRLAREVEENKQYWATEGLKLLRQSIDGLKTQISPALRHRLSIMLEEGNQIAHIVIANPTSTHKMQVRKIDLGFEIMDGGKATEFRSIDKLKEAIGKFVSENLSA